MADEAATPAMPEIPEDLSALNDDELRGLHAELEAAYQGLRTEANTPEHVAQLRTLREQQAAIVTVASDRIALANDLQNLDADAPVLPDPPAPAPEDSAAEEEAPADPPETSAAAPVAVTAAVTAEEIAGNREPGSPPPANSPARPRVASLVAPAGSRIVEPGAALDLETIGAAVTDLARGASYEGRVRVASLTAFEAEPGLREEVLTLDSISRNDALIRQAGLDWRTQYDAAREARHAPTGPMARTASICDPLDAIRDIPDCVQSAEPFSDSLPSRPAGRLGFQYTPSMSLATMAAGVAIWNEANQAAVVATDQSTWKPCVDVVCPSPASVRALAVTACFKADNTTDMSNPERVRDAMSKINAQRARSKTGRLLQIADSLSSHFEFSAPYGALDGLMQSILTTLPQGEYPERLDDGTPYVLYTPPGMLEALVIDRMNMGFRTDVDTGSVIAYIERECAAAGWNVSVVDIEDVEEGGQTPFAPLPTVGVGNKVALPALGGTTRPFKARLLAPESALYFSTGSIEMGIERSPELNRQNKFQWFAEEYVGLAKHGCHPWYTLHLTLCPNGTRAGLTTPYACPTSAS